MLKGRRTGPAASLENGRHQCSMMKLTLRIVATHILTASPQHMLALHAQQVVYSVKVQYLQIYRETHSNISASRSESERNFE